MVEVSSIVGALPETGLDVCQSQVLRRELDRGTALISRDVEQLDTLIADDLIHIHGNGQIEGKPEYLEGIRTKYRFYRVDRTGLAIRIYGSVAVLTGPILQVFSIAGDDRKFETEGLLTQVWLKADADWRLNTYHMQFLKMDGRPVS
ncbi:hypothetical protein FHR22_002309 [Sphingopyxis panaciterrae]|uniref:nuclear transport factor 2 family protein n=1 Tax=Sphingopyxis panaciterrae TaxID=363841 RepID=UPI001423AAB1|nr:nuclear transport factor 2 family protein [Sphingopyxis panaciterrae]NIJ37625.1 hypothetical protein [Sphingopyxis panaciterrae]